MWLWNNTTIILAEYQASFCQKVLPPKKAETTLPHEHFAVLPTTNHQMIHYVIIKNLIISHNHVKKTRLPKKNLKQKQQPRKAKIEEKTKNTVKKHNKNKPR